MASGFHRRGKRVGRRKGGVRKTQKERETERVICFVYEEMNREDKFLILKNN